MKTCRSYTLLLLAPAADVDNAESSVADPGKTKVSAVVALAESSLGVAPVSVPVGSSGGGMGVVGSETSPGFAGKICSSWRGVEV